MTQLELDRAVAAATGETVSQVQHLGFSIADPLVVQYDPEPCSFLMPAADWRGRPTADSAQSQPST